MTAEGIIMHRHVLFDWSVEELAGLVKSPCLNCPPDDICHSDSDPSQTHMQPADLDCNALLLLVRVICADAGFVVLNSFVVLSMASCFWVNALLYVCLWLPVRCIASVLQCVTLCVPTGVCWSVPHER